MTFHAVIFDRDGVLVDFDLEAAAAFLAPLLPIGLNELTGYWQAWGARVGFPATVQEEQAFWRGMWQYVSEELGLPVSVQARLQAFDYTRTLRLFPDVRPALQCARRHGLRVGVLSNFSLATIDASLEAVGLTPLVDVAAAAPVIGVAKPDPEAYRHVLSRLDVQPERCLFFDDERPHVAGARALGMDAYLVDRQLAGHDLSRHVVCDLSALGAILDADSRQR